MNLISLVKSFTNNLRDIAGGTACFSVRCNSVNANDLIGLEFLQVVIPLLHYVRKV